MKLEKKQKESRKKAANEAARRRKIEKRLREVGNKFVQVLKEEVDSAVILCDVGRLERLTSIVHIHMDSEVIRALREKGFDKDIRELCDRAGVERSRAPSP